jgi:hypothetical protein
MLADLVGGVHVEAVSGTQLLDQLATKLGLLSLFSSSDFKLSQPITSATDHQVVKLHALPSATEGIESLTNRGSLSDRMARTASRHPVSVAPGTAPLRGLHIRVCHRCGFEQRPQTRRRRGDRDALQTVTPSLRL